MSMSTLMQTSIAPIAPACAIEPVVIEPSHAATVVVVDGGEHVVDLLESVFGAGPFDVVMVESSARAYSQIRRAQPSLVIVSVSFGDPSGFQVLSMLALDKTTSHIPVLIHATEDPPRVGTPVAESAML